MKKPFGLDEIERAIDRAITDKDRAARIKTALHQEYELTRPGNRSTARAAPEANEDAEEFWDNVPL